MGWSIGYDSSWDRDIGYGVPAQCDHPGCNAEIDRGLAFVCGSEPYGGEQGCGLYFCADHLLFDADGARVCSRCATSQPPFEPTPDVREWVLWKLTDESWSDWRMVHPDFAATVITRCRICGCIDTDCSGCIARAGQACTWTEPWHAGVANLCSACATTQAR